MGRSSEGTAANRETSGSGSGLKVATGLPVFTYVHQGVKDGKIVLPWDDALGAAGAARQAGAEARAEAGSVASSSTANDAGGDGALWSMLSGEVSGDDRASGDLLASRSLT